MPLCLCHCFYLCFIKRARTPKIHCCYKRKIIAALARVYDESSLPWLSPTSRQRLHDNMHTINKLIFYVYTTLNYVYFHYFYSMVHTGLCQVPAPANFPGNVYHMKYSYTHKILEWVYQVQTVYTKYHSYLYMQLPS